MHVLGSDQEAVLHQVALHGGDVQPVSYLVVAVNEDFVSDVNIISWRQRDSWAEGEEGKREERERGDREGVCQLRATTHLHSLPRSICT